MTPAAMAALHARCFRVPRPWSAAEFTDLLASPHVFARAESAGFAMGRAVAAEVEVLTLAVDPAARRQGVGRRLVEAILDEARARGAARAFLEVVPGNLAAVCLYKGLGFTLCGRRPGYYHQPDGPRLDADVMERAL